MTKIKEARLLNSVDFMRKGETFSLVVGGRPADIQMDYKANNLHVTHESGYTMIIPALNIRSLVIDPEK